MELKWSRQNLNSCYEPRYHKHLEGTYVAFVGAILKKHHTQVQRKIKQQISNNHIAILGKKLETGIWKISRCF